MKQLEAPVPNTRLTSVHSIHFSGVDGCGPFLLRPIITSDDPESPRKSKRVMKFYILKFVFSYFRCLDLEVLVVPISTENIPQEIQRFTARRGKIDFFRTQLAAAKSKLININQSTSIPRLELSATVLLDTLATRCKKSFPFIPKENVILNSDWQLSNLTLDTLERSI